jgi:hypothetical protein
MSSTFARACRAADARARKRRKDPDLDRFRRLLDPNISFQQAEREINAHCRSQGAAAATVDALVFVLRRGLDAIKHPDNQRRLRELSDAQMHEVAVRVQNFMSHVAPAWQSADVAALISLWSKLR